MDIEKQDQIKLGMELYLSGKNLTQSSKESKISLETLRRHLKKQDLVRSNKVNSRKYHLNDDYFNEIDTEEKAYWLGFMYADGFLSKIRNEKCVGISLGSKDKSHLSLFVKSIDATYPINDYKVTCGYGQNIEYSRLLMRTDKMFDALELQGCGQHKSLVLEFPTQSQIPDKNLNHFVRGYFDGDGSFAKSHDNAYQFKVCGTMEFLNGMLKAIGFEDQKLYKRYKDNKNNYYCSVGGRKQVTRIGDWMYANSTISLERKLSRYLHLKQIETELSDLV